MRMGLILFPASVSHRHDLSEQSLSVRTYSVTTTAIVTQLVTPVVAVIYTPISGVAGNSRPILSTSLIMRLMLYSAMPRHPTC